MGQPLLVRWWLSRHCQSGSLVGSTLELAVAQVLASGYMSDLEIILCQTGKAAYIMAVLQTLHCLPVTGVELLIRVIEEMHRVDQSRVDMSKLQLTRDQVIHILHSTQLAAKVLDLSHNTVLVASDIPAIVAAAGPTLRRLVLMDCPVIEGPSLLSLIGERPQELKCLEGILHPALLTLEKPDPYPSSFTFVNVKSTGTWVCTSIALFTPAQVV